MNKLALATYNNCKVKFSKLQTVCIILTGFLSLLLLIAMIFYPDTAYAGA